MFLMFGITNDRRELDFHQQVICGVCGKYGSYKVYMTYMVFSLFLIPCIKWNQKFYVESSCCGTVFELNPEVGRRIARGEQVEITQEDLYIVSSGQGRKMRKDCRNCGYSTEEDFEFCPKCGNRF